MALEQFLLELLQEPDSGIVLSFLLLFCPSLSLEMSRNGRRTTLSIVWGAESLSPSLLVGLKFPLISITIRFSLLSPTLSIQLKYATSRHNKSEKMCLLFFFLNQVQKNGPAV